MTFVYFILDTTDADYVTSITDCEKRHKARWSKANLSVVLSDDGLQALVKVDNADIKTYDDDGNLLSTSRAIDWTPSWKSRDTVINEYDKDNTARQKWVSDNIVVEEDEL